MPAPQFPPTAVDALRERCQRESTREFKARGYLMKRCPQCMIGDSNCICAWRKPQPCGLEFVLLMHRDEIFKPTNTGRLIADLFPEQCHAFIWDRTQPPEGLLELLADPRRHCMVLFPPEVDEARPVLTTPHSADPERITTVIVPDGTWRQARKMAKQSQWLTQLPLFDLSAAMDNTAHELGGYRVRHAYEPSRLSTAEAAALVLDVAGEHSACERLMDFFAVFNEHYVASRMNRIPARLDAHARLES